MPKTIYDTKNIENKFSCKGCNVTPILFEGKPACPYFHKKEHQGKVASRVFTDEGPKLYFECTRKQ